MSGLTRHGRLKFDPTTVDIDGACNDNIGVYLRDGYGLQLTSTEVDDCQALDVFIKNPRDEDGYLLVNIGDVLDVETSPDAYLHDGYGIQISSTLCDGKRALDVNIACPTNEDGYVLVDIGDSVINVATTTEMEIADCPLVDGYAAGSLQSFIGDKYRRLYVNDAPNIAGATTVNSVGDSAELLVASSLDGRTRILVQNKGDSVLYLGFSGGVTADDTATGGFELDCGDVISLELGHCIDLYGIAESGSTALAKIMELA